MNKKWTYRTIHRIIRFLSIDENMMGDFKDLVLNSNNHSEEEAESPLDGRPRREVRKLVIFPKFSLIIKDT